MFIPKHSELDLPDTCVLLLARKICSPREMRRSKARRTIHLFERPHGRKTMDMPKGCKVLVIDKDSNVGDLLELILHHRGDQVRTTLDEHKGLVLAKQDQPDLILLD